MRIIDVSWPIEEAMPTYPGDPPFVISPVATHARDGFAVRSLSLATHTGTHIDAPVHLAVDGRAADEIPLGWLCGRARVVDARHAGRVIDERFVASLDLEGVERLLLRTTSELLPRHRFDESHAVLTAAAARRLAATPTLRLLGFDYLTMEPEGDPSLPVHRALLCAARPIILLEAIDLRAVTPGDYELWCLPLRLTGADGAPARAVLVDRRAQEPASER